MRHYLTPLAAVLLLSSPVCITPFLEAWARVISHLFGGAGGCRTQTPAYCDCVFSCAPWKISLPGKRVSVSSKDGAGSSRSDGGESAPCFTLYAPCALSKTLRFSQVPATVPHKILFSLTSSDTPFPHPVPGQNITDTYAIRKVLGKGQFGTTRLATHISSGKDMACKTINKKKLT